MDRLRPPSFSLLALLALSLAFTCDVRFAQGQMNGQAGVTNGLYGRPTAQPYFDFPNWARFSNCRPGPLPWGYDVFPDYGPCDCACNGVPSVGCPGDFVAHRPSSWYASADFAPMTIDYGSDVPLVRPFVAAPPGFALGALTTDDLNPEFNAGGKFTVGKRIFDCYRVEATYLGSYDWISSAIARSPAANLSTILGGFTIPPDLIFDSNTEVFIAQQAQMNSAEANLRYWIDMPPGPFDVSFLVGARYMRIEDRFRLHSTSAAGENDVLSETDNEMLGVQIGLAFDVLIHPRYWVNVDLKGGMYNNVTSIDFALDSFDPAEDVALAGEAERTAFVGEISVVGKWQITPTMVFNLGYQAIFADGVALGFENVVNQPFLNGINPPPAVQFDDSGHLAYHGPMIGLMWIR